MESQSPHYVLIEAGTSSPHLTLDTAIEAFFEDGMTAGLILDGVIASSEQQRRDFWNLREHLPEGEVLNGGSVKHDVSVRISWMSEFIEKGASLIRELNQGARSSIYGHVGDGNVHFNVVAPEGADAREILADVGAKLSPRIYDLVDEMGGSYSAEYGLGQDKLALDTEYGDPIKRELMQRIKSTIDPNRIMNPEKVVPA